MSDPQQNSGRLGQITPRSAGRAINRHYSAFVKAMRIILPLVALGMLAVLLLWPEGEKIAEPVRKEELFPQADMAATELLKPRYESADRELNPFIVTADKATQTQDNADLIYLDKPVADITLKDGGKLDVSSENGIFAQSSEKLSLKGNVELVYDQTYTLSGDEMRVDLKGREAFSDQDVILTGPDGIIKAKGMEAYSERGLVIFKGPGTLTLYPEQDKTEPEKEE